MSCGHVVEVECVHALSCLRKSLGGLDPRRIAVCWSGACEDQEQRSYLRRARVRLRMAGLERGEEWGQCKKEGVEFVTHDLDGEARGALNSAGRRGCMCRHWQGEGEMECRRWLEFKGGVGVVGQGGSEGIVQV